MGLGLGRAGGGEGGTGLAGMRSGGEARADPPPPSAPCCQVNGKMRGSVEVEKEVGQEDAVAVARGLPSVAKQLEGKEVKKVRRGGARARRQSSAGAVVACEFCAPASPPSCPRLSSSPAKFSTSSPSDGARGQTGMLPQRVGADGG